MNEKSSAQIRQEFFDFFRKKDHLIVESAPVVPEDDPTLLFINAGMNPFKPIFLGEKEGYVKDSRLYKRIANTQRCIRVSGKHNDLEEVGHDTYHHTLFEMLGNWSFGDYFKKEAIAWAWELLVDEWGLDPDRLYATVFGGDEEDGLPPDEEAEQLWASETPINKDHILRFGKEDNFWEMGDVGPCGPCSEVHVDMRSDEERKKLPGAELVNKDDPRVMEIWNLVFIQFNRQQDGRLKTLPAQHVDTGMGFERIAAVLNNKRSNYDTDAFTPLLDEIGKLSGKTYGQDEKTDIAFRVIADHIRAVSLAVADGASPSNEGRGYVIRRILRRAIRYGWDQLGLKEPFMHKLLDVLVWQLKEVFPELDKQRSYIENVILSEEKSFLRTLGQGIELFESMADGKKEISGQDAFKLHDTYGFPIDLTELMARERGMKVDVEGFNAYMQEQKERARSAGKFKPAEGEKGIWTLIAGDEESKFVGYDHHESAARILGYDDTNGKPAVLLDRTPFYAESGGQIADTGVIESDDETLKVLDVQLIDGKHVHFVDKLPNNPDQKWHARIDSERREEIQKHHTVTHIVHAAMRKLIGDHVQQKGSLVAPDRLRFDFTHYEALSPQLMDEIEELVNEKIQENIERYEQREIPLKEAKKQGATMIFGEKYGEKVRVITFDPEFSKELCGGTHVRATGEIGYFRLVNETSAAAGIRRIEAVVGHAADELLRTEKHDIESIRKLLKGDRPAAEVEKLLEERKKLQKELEEMKKRQSAGKLDQLLNSGKPLGDTGITLITGEVDGADMPTLKKLGYDALNRKSENVVVILGSRDGDSGKGYLMTAVSQDVIERGVKAGAIVGELAKIIGGGGGGQPNLATAGGKNPDKLPEALDSAEDVVARNLSK